MVSERDQAQRMMGWHQQRAAVLEIGYAERAKWAEATRDVAEDARLAAEELSRRNRDATRVGTVTPGPRTVGAGPQRTRDTGQDTTEQRSAAPASERVGDQQRTAVGEQEQSLAAAMARLREAIGARAAQGPGVEGQEPGQRPTGAAQKQDSATADPYARLRAWRQERAEAAAYRRGEDSGQETSRQRAAAETARQQRDHGYERPQHQAQEQGQEMDGPSLGY